MLHLFLDESGDLGLDFEQTRPSRFLTIAILATSQTATMRAIENAVRKTLRRKVNSKKKCEQELKGTATDIAVKRHFYQQIEQCRFGIYAITLDKSQVGTALRGDAASKSRLYNFLAHQVLDQIPFEDAQGSVQLIVDKSKGRREIREFNDHALTQVQARIDPRVNISIFHRDSCADRCLSAIDLFCWGIHRKHEWNDEEWYSCYKNKIICDERYL